MWGALAPGTSISLGEMVGAGAPIDNSNAARRLVGFDRRRVRVSSQPLLGDQGARKTQIVRSERSSSGRRKELLNFITSNDTTRSKKPFFGDAALFTICLGIIGFGLVILFSTTGVTAQERLGDQYYYLKRQGAALAAGLFLMIVLSRLSIDWLRRYSSFALPLALLLLGLTLIPGLGDSAGGAKRWIVLGSIRFQPGELVKLLFLLFLARYLYKQETRLSTFVYGVIIPVGLCSLLGSLLLMQPDFGSTAVLFGITILLLAVSGMRLRYLGLAVLVAVAAAGALIVFSPYRMQRVIAFLSPWQDASGKGYQLIQSLIAVGTGNLFGVGLGASQQKLFFLPAAHTDFILAVIAEELGFVGVLGVICAYLLILWRGIKIALRWVNDVFGFALALGMTALIVLPAFLNMGVVSGLLPTKGMVLPLIAYGGSNLISSCIAIGILLALSRSEPKQL